MDPQARPRQGANAPGIACRGIDRNDDPPGHPDSGDDGGPASLGSQVKGDGFPGFQAVMDQSGCQLARMLRNLPSPPNPMPGKPHGGIGCFGRPTLEQPGKHRGHVCFPKLSAQAASAWPRAIVRFSPITAVAGAQCSDIMPRSWAGRLVAETRKARGVHFKSRRFGPLLGASGFLDPVVVSRQLGFPA